LNKSIKLILNYFLGPVLFVVLSYSLYKQIIRQPDLEIRWEQVRNSWKSPLGWLVIALMPINWGIESLKWKHLMAPLEQIPFSRAFKAVFAGCSITMLTPNRIGEYGGRIMYVKDEHRLRAISVTILGSISQLAITLIMGSIGIFYLSVVPSAGPKFSDLPWGLQGIIPVISVLCAVLLLFMYFNVHTWLGKLQHYRVFRSLIKHIAITDAFTRKQLLRIFFLSFLRFMVFILQYLILLKVMDVQIGGMLSFWVLTIFYLVMVLAPTIGFTELPVRATASVAILGLYSTNVLGIQAATFGIWLINLVLPALIGSIFILGVKIMKEK